MRYDQEGHILISPVELSALAFDNPDALINHWLLPGTPMAFATSAQHARFVDYLSDYTGIHPHQFLFRGSTKIGFSISPDRENRKTWRRFGPSSDLDLAIVDPHFYETLDEQVRRWDRLPENRSQVYRYRTGAEFRQYQDRIYQKGRHDCYRFFDVPRGIECLAGLQRILDGAPIAGCCVHDFVDLRAFVFRDRWAVHRRYHTDLDDLRRGLTARDNRLLPAPEAPLDPEQP
jgi:hypothetical protein